MKFSSLIVSVVLASFSVLNGLDARYYSLRDQISVTIVVDKNGKGQFTSVQQAVDSIPSNNSVWTRIYLKPGVYVEKVQIKQPYIILEGDLNHCPVIEFGDAGNVVTSPTFQQFADNFVARNIVVKNTYDRLLPLKAEAADGLNTTWAPAAAIAGDKASFYHCSFISLQDTLTDAQGRHYFYDCHISGAIDFIWGNGQSIYEKCQINSLASKLGQLAGYITAQARDNANETSGFVFKNCHVTGSGPINLGRARAKYARVLFAGTRMDNVITPQGWDAAWNKGYESSITFSEFNCSGPGANKSKRIRWEKKLSVQDVNGLISLAFINQDGWIEKQPI